MKIFKFEIEWRQENWEVRGDDTNQLKSVARMKGFVNIISTSEELARLAFNQLWQYHPWLEKRIVQLVFSESVYLTAILPIQHEGSVLEVSEKEQLKNESYRVGS